MNKEVGINLHQKQKLQARLIRLYIKLFSAFQKTDCEVSPPKKTLNGRNQTRRRLFFVPSKYTLPCSYYIASALILTSDFRLPYKYHWCLLPYALLYPPARIMANMRWFLHAQSQALGCLEVEVVCVNFTSPSRVFLESVYLMLSHLVKMFELKSYCKL